MRRDRDHGLKLIFERQHASLPCAWDACCLHVVEVHEYCYAIRVMPAITTLQLFKDLFVRFGSRMLIGLGPVHNNT